MLVYIVGALVALPIVLYVGHKLFILATRKPRPPRPKKQTRACVSIVNPGGFEELCLTDAPHGTIGANVPGIQPNLLSARPPIPNLVHVEIASIGVNYADCCIRWGVYESAKKYVGWPITPGFEFCGKVVGFSDGTDELDIQFDVGDYVFGVTLFGAYSTHVWVPLNQVFPKPPQLDVKSAGGFLCTYLTAAYALFELTSPKLLPHVSQRIEEFTEENLGRPMDKTCAPKTSVLIHSAAGGVGSTLVQLCKNVAKFDMVVGVCGGAHKVETCMSLGCDVAINYKTDDIWRKAKEICPDGFDIIFDANGIATLASSYSHLKPTGKLVSYGSTTLLPHTGSISIFQWGRIVLDVIFRAAKFDPMKMTSQNRSVFGFNLSFLFSRVDLLQEMIANLNVWLEEGLIKSAPVSPFEFAKEGAQAAHRAIQSGETVGKLVLVTPTYKEI